MLLSSRGEQIFKMAILILLSSVLMSCSLIKTQPVIVQPESQVQKMLKGESANFSGYLLTDSALSQLLESAEKCK